MTRRSIRFIHRSELTKKNKAIVTGQSSRVRSWGYVPTSAYHAIHDKATACIEFCQIRSHTDIAYCFVGTR